MKTERLVILVTPEQKRALTRRARALDVSVAELLRRSSEGAGAGGDEASLSALAAQLLRSVKESRAALRTALAETETTLKQIRRRRPEEKAA